jgi:NRAMP (natural resistance-associated macrophage protein)-like metal ion transporter
VSAELGVAPAPRRGRGAEPAPPPRPSLRRRLLLIFAVLGPGLIAANAGNDAGGIVTYASAGAQFGYRTLFVMLVVTVGLVVVQEMCARLGAFTGQGLGALIREQFSLRVTAFALVLLLVANTGLVVSEFAGIAAAMELLHISRYISVPLAALAIWALVTLGSYRYAERLFLLLSVVFIAYPVAALLAHPDWGTAGSSLVLPHVLGTRSFLLLSVALIGTTITPYMQFYVAAAVADRGAGPSEYAATRLDTVSGAIFADLISMFIIIATAAAIHVRAPLQSAAQAAHALRPVVGRAATELFTFEVALGAGVALVPGNLISLLVNAQILNGIITPILLGFILVLANRRSVLGDAANGRAFRIVATVSVVVVAIMAAGALITTFV